MKDMRICSINNPITDIKQEIKGLRRSICKHPLKHELIKKENNMKIRQFETIYGNALKSFKDDKETLYHDFMINILKDLGVFSTKERQYLLKSYRWNLQQYFINDYQYKTFKSFCFDMYTSLTEQYK